MRISLAEAKSMMSEESLQHLHDVVNEVQDIDMSRKSCNDILMSALCYAVSHNIIDTNNLDEKITKMLNSSTSTLSETKLHEILIKIKNSQPRARCIIKIKEENNAVLHKWTILDDDISFNEIFGILIDEYHITPQMVRKEMTNTLQRTIVNNIAQDVAQYLDPDRDPADCKNISITTITRIVNMLNLVITAEITA